MRGLIALRRPPRRKQSAAAGRNENHVNERQVAQDFERDGALTGHDVLIVERMDELGAGLLTDLARLGVGFIVDVARENDVRAVALRRGDLGDGVERGMTMVDLTPTELAAKATPCAWLPAEEATTACRSPSA